MRYTQILAASTLGLLLAAGCTKAETPVDAAAKPVAVVNGTPISRDVWTLYVKTRHGGKAPGDLTAEEQKDALEELIGMYAGAQEAEQKKLGEANRTLASSSSARARRRAALQEFVEGAEPTERSSRPSTPPASPKPRRGVSRTTYPRRRRSAGEEPHRAARQGREL